jgi:hypothetical protein
LRSGAIDGTRESYVRLLGHARARKLANAGLSIELA